MTREKNKYINLKQGGNNSVTILAALLPLLLVYLPRPPISGSHIIIYPLIGSIILVFTLFLAQIHRSINSKIIILIFLYLLYSACFLFSFLLNSDYLRSTAGLELTRPILLITILLFGYYLGLRGGERRIEKGLLTASYLILMGQLVISLLQLNGYQSFLGLIYSTEKTRELGSLLRVTGSLGNPNVFAWVISQASMSILILSSSKTKFFWLCIGLILVVISGSRALLITFPLILLVSLILRYRSNPRAKQILNKQRFKINKAILLFFFGFTLVVGAALILLVTHFSSIFPYLSELGLIFEGKLTSIRTVSLRLVMWSELFQMFNSQNYFTWFLGLGARDALRVVDNDYLYVFFRVGVIGLLAHFGIIFYILKVFSSDLQRKISDLGMQYLLGSLFLGLVYETISGWFFPTFLFLYLGISIGLIHKFKRMKSLHYSK